MDKKKKMTVGRRLMIGALMALTLPLAAQNVSEVSFCGHKVSNDSISLFLKILDNDGKKLHPLPAEMDNKLIVKEDGLAIQPDRREIVAVTTGKSIPDDFTFSVLVDLNIPEEGKNGIYEAVEKLIDKAPDSCVYLSFFGDEVTSSMLVTKDNFGRFEDMLKRTSSVKYFYGALYAKLAEFDFSNIKNIEEIHRENNYVKNEGIFRRARQNVDRNYLIVFTEGYNSPEVEYFDYDNVTAYQRDPDPGVIRPKVYAFYYTRDGRLDQDVELTFRGITTNSKIPDQYKGKYKPSENMDEVLKGFEEVVNEASYDYEFKYKCLPARNYIDVRYAALWGDDDTQIGSATYSIGYTEKVTVAQDDSKGWVKYIWALLVTALTIVFFFIVMKILVPSTKSKVFAAKYYKKYVPEANVQRRICYWCKREILPGERVVTRCRHIMHVPCWKQNDYHCGEYGQNCKEGIQEHVKWDELLSPGSLRDLYLAIWGIVAGLVSWIIYSLIGGQGFTGFAKGIAKAFLSEDRIADTYGFDVCVGKISSLLVMGMLLGFFLSLVMRYNDGVRKNDFRSLMKTFGLSLLSSAIGFAAFALGSIILCRIVSIPDVPLNEWYCSLPAYLLFSVCTSLSLAILSSIPLKSALLGGLASAVIGFLVLYFTNITSVKWDWMRMLLNFIIYGGGLGASLVTVRMLAEKYFLVIKNGLKAGTKIPIHKWMNATGGSNTVTIGMTERCEIQMTWEKSNKVAKEHVKLYVDHQRSQAMLSPLENDVVFNSRTKLPVGNSVPLTNNDTFTVGDTIFQYVEN